MPERFDIDYASEATDDLKQLRAGDRKKVLTAVAEHLRHEPTKVSRSRIKKMDEPFWSQYRLRVDDFRVYYDVDDDAGRVVVHRILEKGRGETLKDPDHEKDRS